MAARPYLTAAAYPKDGTVIVHLNLRRKGELLVAKVILQFL
jgi:hypothetical protein